MGATTASEKNEIRASPPDHNERRNASSELLARVVSSLSERSASATPSPIILLSQAGLDQPPDDSWQRQNCQNNSICNLLRYRVRLSIKFQLPHQPRPWPYQTGPWQR
jgi:hypothetical protein